MAVARLDGEITVTRTPRDPRSRVSRNVPYLRRPIVARVKSVVGVRQNTASPRTVLGATSTAADTLPTMMPKRKRILGADCVGLERKR